MNGSAEFSLFVGDLAPDVTDQYLETFFRQYFSSVRSGKVIMDRVTGKSKGYGFMRFSLESERDKALEDMNGALLSTRPIRVNIATVKKETPEKKRGLSSVIGGGETDPNNTTLFIGGLSPLVTEEELQNSFIRFGEIVYTKIPHGKGCGFVQYKKRKVAEVAFSEMNGMLFQGQAVRISWGRSSGRVPLSKATIPSVTSTGSYGFNPNNYPYIEQYNYPATFPDPYTYPFQGVDPYMQQQIGYGAPYNAINLSANNPTGAASTGTTFHNPATTSLPQMIAAGLAQQAIGSQMVPVQNPNAPLLPNGYLAAQNLSLDNRNTNLFATAQRPISSFYGNGAVTGLNFPSNVTK
mmetsp:Transcript_33777/g.60985  ORF Transcript_33777/g.60985 Transcript_33777/m.60985 type:complete len:351 (-) Transcript_33777:69-1121(-)|eukprot:CAMPEP_0175047032 /NCGR_PEP_ID=MMETSP0052_2-20121109/5365_1 /TAXON_ID=51329 ORGANISM="Polytomella parva, Strain SAG 63-3" /NCGR_SAMPLE_ID=MMETSP0052_2 /ASSEMBLY_ACC=CAM_ASM_000194 /LENGTH=350 /DNA_ID=CAMNT_0016310853 /DNA_START=98 /DNA_END=1150 /DNA_ORIENTATION=-